jgi:DNA-binding beta-propeller fold protein YncE
MKDTNKFLIAGFAALFTWTNAFGQQGYTNPDPLHMKCAIDWINNTRDYIYHQETESQCIGGTWHDLTYVYTFGNKATVPLMDVDTGKPCACGTGTDSGAEDNCDSPIPYDNSSTGAVNSQGLSNGSSKLIGTETFSARSTHASLAPMGAALGSNRQAGAATTKGPRAAVAGSAAYVLTLPYRTLPAAPLLVGELPIVQPVCLSSVNPTYFETWHLDNLVKRFNACTGAAVATINVQSLPLQVRVTPDGSQAIVTHFSSAISFIDTTSNTVTHVMQTPASFTPSGLAISPDGTYALVTNLEPAGQGGSAIGVVDIASQTMTSMIPLDYDYPQSVFINPDATLAWVVFPFNNAIEVIDLLTGAAVQAFNFDEPLSVAFNPTGTFAYVAAGTGVLVLDTASYALVTTVQTGAAPSDLVVTPDGAYLVVNNSSGRSVSVIDTQTLVATTLTVPGVPRGNVPISLQ